jgi:pimeloyl-ACP methyl ester carboxylesterase
MSVENQTAELPGRRTIGYAEYGDPAGSPVFFFHGWPSSRLHGHAVHEAALAKGLRVIAPDRPGIGLSSPQPGRSFSSWPADVAALADRLGFDRFLLMGISGGAPYTLATAAALPDRVKAAAIVCGAPPFGDPADRAHMHFAYRTLSGNPAVRRAAMPIVLRTSRWMIGRGPDRLPMSLMLKSIPQRDRDAIIGGGWQTMMRSYLEASHSPAANVLQDGELYLQPWDFQPEDIQVPVAFWHGVADANLPIDVAKRLAARIPHAETHWIEGEGHYSLPVHYGPAVAAWLLAHA